LAKVGHNQMLAPRPSPLGPLIAAIHISRREPPGTANDAYLAIFRGLSQWLAAAFMITKDFPLI
jgi:hypothetical protein